MRGNARQSDEAPLPALPTPEFSIPAEQYRDVHVLAIKKLVTQESINHDIFPENVRVFARNYFKQKKSLWFVNNNGVLCVKYYKSQRKLLERP